MSGLEPSRAEVEAWVEAVARRVLDHVDALPTAPAVGTIGADGLARARALSLRIPEAPTKDFESLLAHVLEATEASLNTAGPGYLAYIPGGGILSAGIADLVANWLNRYTGLSAASPALCRLEADVLSWLAGEFGYGEDARGLLTPGGSMANFSAIVAARHDKLGDDGDYRDARVYTSSQAHHSVTKSVALAGIPRRNVVAVPTDNRLRLRADAFDAAVRADLAAGRRPFLLVSAVGTTNTGAVDPLAPLGDVCERHGLWHHVDGAYGGAFALCPTGRARMAGLERADSITFDPHKGMFLPYGTGCLLVRDGRTLRQAHRADAEYLQDFDRLERDGEPPSPTEYGPELSRDFRGLRVWLPLQLHGAAAFREALEEKLTLTASLAEALHRVPGLEIVDPPQLSVVPFRLARRAAETLDDWNARNTEFCESINAKQRVYLSTTRLPVHDGAALTLRACILSFRTHANVIEAAAEDIAAAAAR